MSDDLAKLVGLNRAMGGISVELLRVQFAHPPAGAASWRPAVNAFRCRDRFTICIDLAGMDKDSIQVTATDRRLIVRGVRPSLEPSSECPGLIALAMEIDHGPFERHLELPVPVDPDGVKAEYRQGILWIELPLRSAS